MTIKEQLRQENCHHTYGIEESLILSPQTDKILRKKLKWFRFCPSCGKKLIVEKGEVL